MILCVDWQLNHIVKMTRSRGSGSEFEAKVKGSGFTMVPAMGGDGFYNGVGDGVSNSVQICQLPGELRDPGKPRGEVEGDSNPWRST